MCVHGLSTNPKDKYYCIICIFEKYYDTLKQIEYIKEEVNPLNQRGDFPVAWAHNQQGRYDVIHNEAKKLWLNANPKQVEHYTIPLYSHTDNKPLSTEAACALLKSVGYDMMLDGNVLKILRAVEQAHGIL